MFKKHLRLNTSEFNEVFKNGKNTKTPLFLIKSKKNNLKHPRFSVVVSKKIAKKAHERNYLKRKAYNAIKDNQQKFSDKKLDHIFILSSDIKDIQYKQLLQEIKNINI